MYLKLFFPGLNSTNNALQLIYSHSALTSVCGLFDEQYQLAMRQILQQKHTQLKNNPFYNRQLNTHSHIDRPIHEQLHNLSFVTDMNSNDFWDGEEVNTQFAHALQFDKEDYRLDDIETVQSEICSRHTRKWSCQSETESIFCSSEVITI